MKAISPPALIGLTVVGLAGLAIATGAAAQTAPSPPAWSPPPGSTGGMPQGGYGRDIWSYMATTRADENVLKIVSKDGWDRARRAAAAINSGKCGEAAAIAASGDDQRLMQGVKRACKLT